MKQPNNAVESSNKKHNGIIGFLEIYVLHINFTIPLRRKNGERGIL